MSLNKNRGDEEMFREYKSHPVDLLHDRKGIYGVGTTEGGSWPGRTLKIVLRSDRLLDEYDEEYWPSAALQMLTSNREVFRFCAEGGLRGIIHDRMLHNAGICLDRTEKFWATNRNEEAKNRKLYHGLRVGSRRIVNTLIARALTEAADPEVLRQARRFVLGHRYPIYRAAAVSRRFLQLTDTFPVLAMAIIRSEGWKSLLARQLVERGVSVKKIACVLDVPMALQRVKPGAAHLALEDGSDVLASNPDLIYAYMPESLSLMKFWLRKVMSAGQVDRDFARFAAKHLFTFGDTTEEITAWLINTADWVRACRRPDDNVGRLVIRPFRANMSVKTVTKLSDQWHESVAKVESGPIYELPEPWVPGGNVDGFEIVPITNSVELYCEGCITHHCVGTYGERVTGGDCYIYSLRKDGQRLATLQLVKSGGRVVFGQIEGPCNTTVSKAIELAARKWLKSHKPFQPPKLASGQPIFVRQDGTGPEQIIRLPEQQVHHPVAPERLNNAPVPLTAEEEEAVAWFQTLELNRADAERPSDDDCDGSLDKFQQ
jgi:hypothetical protein